MIKKRSNRNTKSILIKENVFVRVFLKKKIQNFPTLNDEQKFIYILYSEEPSILTLIGKCFEQ